MVFAENIKDSFVDFRTDYNYSNQISYFFRIETQKTNVLLAEYLHFGRYLRVIKAGSIGEKIYEMDEIYQSYISKDISLLLKIQKTEKISDLVRLMASQIGRLVNYHEIS